MYLRGESLVVDAAAADCVIPSSENVFGKKNK